MIRKPGSWPIFIITGKMDKKEYEVSIDHDDVDHFLRFVWHVRIKNFLPVAYRMSRESVKRSRKIYLHNEVMNLQDSFRVSPRNGNWLDCRKANLHKQPIEHYLEQAGKV